MKFFTLGFALTGAVTAAIASPALAADWTVQPAQSTLGFSGMQTGAPFQGVFTQWTAQISFDPANPQAAHVKVIIKTASAKTGDTQRDTAMPDPDWFDVSAFPQAVFEATGFTPEGGNKYQAAGTLTIRGVSQKVALPFTLVITGNQAEAKGEISLLRTAYGVGQGNWSSGDWVGLNAGVTFDLVAVKNGA
jgi:polyisoprenoid-binding protein YceI